MVPPSWTELLPRGWSPTARYGVIVLAPGDVLRFLVGVTGEPLALAAGGGLTGVDSGEPHSEALVVERPKMGWLRRLALDRPDIERALLQASAMQPGVWLRQGDARE